MLLCSGGMPPVAAQQPAADGARFAPAAERAAQEGDKVFKRILLNGAIQRRIVANPPAEPPAAAPAPKATTTAKAPPPAPRQDKAAGSPAQAGTRPPTAAMAQPVARPGDAATPVAEPPAVVAEPAQVNVATPVTAPPPPAPPQVDEPLVVLHEVEPDFPISIVRRQKKGNLVMRFVVQPDGTVAQIEVVKTINPFLNPSATHALSQWRFQPLSRARTATVEMAFDVAQQLSE